MTASLGCIGPRASSPPLRGSLIEEAVMNDTSKLTKADLQQFTGTDHYYRHAINPHVLFTDGAKYLADKAGAYWLLNEIALIQRYNRQVAVEEFQVWTLSVDANDTASLKCDDGNGNVVFSKDIGFTDFPLDEVKLWFANDVIYLPSEH
jgi:hypothetical protein